MRANTSMTFHSKAILNRGRSFLNPCEIFLTREFIALLLFLHVAASVVLALPHKDMLISNSLEPIGLQVISSKSPDFQMEIHKLLNKEDIDHLGSSIANSVIIVNNTSRYIWGFSAVYTFPNLISPSGNPRQFRINCAVGFGASRSRMFGPGDRYLITPIPDIWASSKANETGSSNPGFSLSSLSAIDEYNSEHPAQSNEIKLLIDSIIFDDGELVGPDTTNRLTAVNDRIRAQTDLIKSIGGEAEVTQHKYLEGIVAAPVAGEYGLTQNGLAANFLSILDSQGEQGLSDMIELMNKQPFIGNAQVHRRAM